MKHLLLIFLLSGLFINPFSVDAQISLQQKRRVLYEVADVLENYEHFMFIDSDENEVYFKNLFTSDNVVLYNDLLGFSSEDQLLLSDYVSIMKEKVMNPTIILKNIKVNDIVDAGDKYQVTVLFDKSLSYSNQCGVLFSNDDYFGKDYNLQMVIEVEKNTNEGKISAIKGYIDSSKSRLQEGNYQVLAYTSPYDKTVKCNGKKINFNSFDQAFIPINSEFSYQDPDMKLRVNKADLACNQITLSYKLKRFNVQPYFEMALSDFYEVKGLSDKLSFSSSMQEFGVKFKYVFPRKSKVKWGLALGAGLSKSKLDFTLEKVSYHYQAKGKDADIDGDDYNRYYDISGANQTVEMTDFVFPLSLEMERKFGSWFSINFEAGVKGYLSIKAETTDFSISQNVYGVYYGYGQPVIFDKPEFWGYNGFGPSVLGMANMSNSELGEKSITADAFAGLGFSLKIWGPLSLRAAVKYQYGFMKIFEPELESVNITSSRVKKDDALINYTLKDGEKAKNLINLTDKVTRQALLINVGLNFNF